jgi:hypothetical protein
MVMSARPFWLSVEKVNRRSAHRDHGGDPGRLVFDRKIALDQPEDIALLPVLATNRPRAFPAGRDAGSSTSRPKLTSTLSEP